MLDFEKEAFCFVNRLVPFFKINKYKKKRQRTRLNSTNLIISYIKVDEEEAENEIKLIPSSNQPNTDPLTSTSSSLPITNLNELTHELQDDNNKTPQTDEKIQNKSKEKKKTKKNNKNKSKSVRLRIELMHCDIIKDEFWDARPGLLYI